MISGSALESAVATLSTKWTGFRYVVGSLTNPLLFSVGVSEIAFPDVKIEYLNQKGLSTHTKRIISGVTYGTLTLKSAVTRNNVLWDYMRNAVNFLENKQNLLFRNFAAQNTYGNLLDTIVIIENGIETALDKAVPISTVACENVQPLSYSFPSANANSGSSMPLETIVFNVGKFYRL